MSDGTVRIDDGGSAFPVGTKTIHKDHYSGNEYADSCGWDGGMSLRDYFAAKAMQSFVLAGATNNEAANTFTSAAKKMGKRTILVTAELAYRMADDMLIARKNGGAA